jgi:Cu/Ag efflux pump CusA
MIRGLISTCLSRRPLVLVAFVAFLAVGFGAFRAMNIEAYPDPAPPIIEIIAHGGMLLSPICSLLVIPTVARLFMPQVEDTPSGEAWVEPHPA